MSVYLDGSTLSALLFTHLNSNGSQYGFLIGEKVEHIEDRISDSQPQIYDVNSYIYVSSFISWPYRESIYSTSGHIKDEWIKKYFGNMQQHKLVGWYSFRHCTSDRPSLRERTLHKNLAKLEQFAGQPKDFLFFLCTSSFSSDMSTHTCSHCFMHISDERLVSVPMTVMNLGDTTRKEYRRRSSASVSHSRTVVDSLHNFRKGFVKPSGEMEQIVKMNHLATSINKSLMAVHSKVFASEAALGLLETDVDNLRQRLEHLEQEEMRRYEMDAERKRKEEDEERRKQNEQEEAEEKEQLDKLLINLGISSDGFSDNVSSLVPGAYHMAPFPLESCLIDQSIVSLPVIDLAPSFSLEHVSESCNDRNTNSVMVDVSAETHTKLTDSEQRNVNGTKVNSNNETKKPQTMKDKVSEAFSFLDEELQLKKQVPTKRQQAIQTRANKSSRLHKETGEKKLVSSTNELSNNMEAASISD